MATVARTRVVRIGNSHGIRIPKLLLEQSGLGDEVEIEARENELVVRPAAQMKGPRDGWDEQFRAMAERGDDRLLDAQSTALSSWDADEWEW